MSHGDSQHLLTGLSPFQHLLHIHQLAGEAVAQVQQVRVADQAAVVQLEEAVDDRCGGLRQLQVVLASSL